MVSFKKLCCSTGVEFQRMDPALSKPDCAEKVSNALLKPLRLACGREVKVQLASEEYFQNKKQLHLIARIFLALIALIILPFTLMGLAISACSKSRQEMLKKYSKAPSPKQVGTPIPLSQWITPEEQLKRLHAPVTKEITASNQAGISIKGVADVVAQYVGLDPILTNWHTALERLNQLPEKIPPLRKDIHKILDSRCPFFGTKKKPDGTFYKVKDTHFLQLIPQELGNLSKFFHEILTSYGESLNPVDPCFSRIDRVRGRGGDASEDPFEPTHWELTVRDEVPGMRNKFSERHEAFLFNLRQKTSLRYEIPYVKNIMAAIFLHKVATGESLYDGGADSHGNLDFDGCIRVRDDALRGDAWSTMFGSRGIGGLSVACGASSRGVGCHIFDSLALVVQRKV